MLAKTFTSVKCETDSLLGPVDNIPFPVLKQFRFVLMDEKQILLE